MKRNRKKRNYALLLSLILVVICSFIGNAQNYTVKNRWNTKIGYSRNQTYENGWVIICPDSWGDMPDINKRASNFRAELNYGVLNWLEVGIYGGFTCYNVEKVTIDFITNLFIDRVTEKSFAPTFGVNVNFHLLPLLVKKEKCRWECYITAKYGGAYFEKWGFKKDDVHYLVFVDIKKAPDKFNSHRYRHEYGLGMGAGVYFWNTFGLYIEVCGGQYSYFPEIFKAWHSIRGGIQFKFTPKPKPKLE